MVKREPMRKLVVGAWTHAHEEDTARGMVFRPAGGAFPPSRGRRSLQLLADGTLIEGTPGPSDRGEERKGSWELRESGELCLFHAGDRTPFDVLRVVDAQDGRLVLQSKPQ